MTFRIGWVSPLSPASGVGTFSHAVTAQFPTTIAGEAIDLTILHPPHENLHASRHRCIAIENTEIFHKILPLFDLLVYNIGNNREHHDVIFRLLRIHPGIVVCHDYVYQHYLAEQSIRYGQNFVSYAALLVKFGGPGAQETIKRSRISSRMGGIRYSPWDSEYSVDEPMGDAFLALGSALVVHSAFARANAATRFHGPILTLGMPHDQKPDAPVVDMESWERAVVGKPVLHLVSFGHIQSTKCIDLVIEAIASSRVLRKRVRYTIAGFVGDSDYFARLEQMIASAGLRQTVTFEIGVSDARLAGLMQEADLFINLRKPNTEGSSASLTEQLAAGRPVLVLDSGCYGEIDADAALKLVADATARDVGNALERVCAKPELLPAIARAGLAHARQWSCASYGERFVTFVSQNRAILAERARMVSIRNTAASPPIDDEAWSAALARARVSLRYLESNVLALDPDMLVGKPPEELSCFVATVILGIFNRPKVQAALLALFDGRKGAAVYWSCVKLALIADAIFDRNEAAIERLSSMAPCTDLGLWGVIEALPPNLYWKAANLFLGQSPARTQGDWSPEMEGDLALGRMRLLEIVEMLPTEPAVETLKGWLEHPLAQDTDADLPVVARDLLVSVGDDVFRATAELSGFHDMETDHAWMRKLRGFIGLRLGGNVRQIALLVRQIHGDASKPCDIALTLGSRTVTRRIADLHAHWIAIDVTAGAAGLDPITWMQVSTSQAAQPPNSLDTRILGACVMQMRVTVASGAEATETRESIAAAL